MLYLPLKTVRIIRDEFMKTLEGYSMKQFDISPLENALIIEDAYVLYVGITGCVPSLALNEVEMFHLRYCETQYISVPRQGDTYYALHIEELTHNAIGHKYRHSKFVDVMAAMTGIYDLRTVVTHSRFRGYRRSEETLAERISALAPELRLRERYDAWEGIPYRFIVMAFEGSDGSKEYAVAFTTRDPHEYAVTACGKWICGGFAWIGDDCTYENICSRDQGVCKAFNSWKGKPRQYRLENHFRYCAITENVKSKSAAKELALVMLGLAYEGAYEGELQSSYERPANRWITEERVYKIVKRLCKEYKVIYQHRPFFLKTADGAQMSYDVFIPGLNVAIEYQGEQHYRPVDYFGGEEGYRKTVARDERKRELSAENGITLVYITWQEKVTPELIKEKIGWLM